MKIKFFFLTTLIALSAVGLLAQAPVSASKIAVFDSNTIAGPAGIKRVLTAFATVEREFKPRMDEITNMTTRYDALVKSINDTRNAADPKTLATKADQAEALKRDITRKQQDGQAAMDKRIQEVTTPLYQDIFTALMAYAKQRGYDLVLDAAKLNGSVMIVNPGSDITQAFITDYNSRYPSAATK